MNNKNQLLLVLFIKLINSLFFLIIMISLNLLLIKKGYPIKKSGELTAVFLGVYFITPLLGGFLTNNFIPIRFFYISTNLFMSISLLSVGLIGMSTGPLVLAILCISLNVQKIAVINVINSLTEKQDILRRKYMLYFYAITNIAALSAFFISFLLFNFGLTSYFLILLSIFPLASNFLFLKIKHARENIEKKHFLFISIFFPCVLGLFYIIFTHMLVVREISIAIILVSIFYFLANIISNHSDPKIIKKGILYIIYFILSVIFFSFKFLNTTVIFDLIGRLKIHIRPQLFNIFESIVAILFFVIISKMVSSLKGNKYVFFITPFLFLLSYLCLYFNLSLFSVRNFTIYNHIGFFIFYYFLITIGEAFISPEGFTLAGRLTPKNIQIYSIGLWGAFISAAYISSSYISDLILNNNIIYNATTVMSGFKIFIPIIIIPIILVATLLEYQTTRK